MELQGNSQEHAMRQPHSNGYQDALVTVCNGIFRSDVGIPTRKVSCSIPEADPDELINEHLAGLFGLANDFLRICQPGSSAATRPPTP